jgi:hypothetical protein
MAMMGMCFVDHLALTNGGGCLQAVHVGHLHVHQNPVEGLPAVPAFSGEARAHVEGKLFPRYRIRKHQPLFSDDWRLARSSTLRRFRLRILLACVLRFG